MPAINQPIHTAIPINATYEVENNPNTTQTSSVNPSTTPSTIPLNTHPSTLSIPPPPSTLSIPPPEQSS